MKNKWQKYTIEKLIAKDGIFVDGDWVESKDQDPNGEVRLIQLADIGEGKFLDKSNRHLTKDKAHKLNCTFLQENDVLFSRLGEPLGKSTLLPKLSGEHVTVVDVAIIRTNNINVNNKLLVYLFNSPVFRADVEKLKSGTTRKRISRKNLSKIEFNLPDKASQDDLAQKLDSLFSKIDAGDEGLQQVQQQLEVYRQAVLKKAFTPIHSSWEVTKIGKEFEVFVGATPSRKEPTYWNGDISWVSSGEVQFCRISKTKETITKKGYDNSSTKIHPKGTVLLGMIGQGKTRGQAAILDIEAATNQNVAAIEVSKTDNIPEFLYYYLQYRYLETRMIGSGNNQKALNKSRVENLDLVLPSPKIQRLVVENISKKFSIIDAVKNQIEQSKVVSKSLRQSILKKAFNGELLCT